MKAEIRYLYHSGFSVATDHYFFVFDYEGEPEGYRPQTDLQTVVFASHRHGDHFSPSVLDWKRDDPTLEIVLSDDIRPREGCRLIGPGETLEFSGIRVSALRSTDEGVAFLVQADGLTIYHAGDLNWWHWNGESPSYNEKMKEDYCKEIDRLRGIPVDIAFVPVDPRLEDKYKNGVDYFARAVHPNMIFPMHLWEDYALIDRLKADPGAAPYADSVVRIERPGQTFLYQSRISIQ